MKVKELIEELNKCNPDALVAVSAWEDQNLLYEVTTTCPYSKGDTVSRIFGLASGTPIVYLKDDN